MQLGTEVLRRGNDKAARRDGKTIKKLGSIVFLSSLVHSPRQR